MRREGERPVAILLHPCFVFASEVYSRKGESVTGVRGGKRSVVKGQRESGGKSAWSEGEYRGSRVCKNVS